MATRGPKPKPTTIRVLEGDPNKSRYNLNEPRPGDILAVDSVPPRVAAMPEALEMWHFLAPRLVAMGIVGDVDRYGLEALCITYAMWAIRPSAQMTSKLQSMLAEFGLTPSSRSRLVANLPKEQKADPIAARLASL